MTRSFSLVVSGPESIIAEFRRVAREHGYAIGEHGSKKRDYDLIACPWIAKAHAPSTLIRALTNVEGVRAKKWDSASWAVSRPHGRRGYVFLFDGTPAGPPHYIDLSVMPRAK